MLGAVQRFLVFIRAMVAFSTVLTLLMRRMFFLAWSLAQLVTASQRYMKFCSLDDLER